MESEVKLEIEDHINDANLITSFISAKMEDMKSAIKEEEPFDPSNFVDTNLDDFEDFNETKVFDENITPSEFIATDIVKIENQGFEDSEYLNNFDHNPQEEIVFREEPVTMEVSPELYDFGQDTTTTSDYVPERLFDLAENGNIRCNMCSQYGFIRNYFSEN